MGFECLGVEEANDHTLNVQLKVRGEREEYPAAIFTDGPSGPMTFAQDVETREVPIRLQVYTFVQHTWQIYETYARSAFEVAGADDTSLGQLVVEADQLAPLKDMAWSADEAREHLAEDTLPDDPMPVVIHQTPRRV